MIVVLGIVTSIYDIDFMVTYVYNIVGMAI